MYLIFSKKVMQTFVEGVYLYENKIIIRIIWLIVIGHFVFSLHGIDASGIAYDKNRR